MDGTECRSAGLCVDVLILPGGFTMKCPSKYFTRSCKVHVPVLVYSIMGQRAPVHISAADVYVYVSAVLSNGVAFLKADRE